MRGRGVITLLLFVMTCRSAYCYSVDQIHLAEVIQEAIIEYSQTLNYFSEDPLRATEFADAGLCASKNQYLVDAAENGGDCVVADFPPGVFPPDLVQLARNSQNAQVSVCDVPVPQNGMSGSIAISLTGKDVSALCPEGAISSFPSSIEWSDTPAVYTVVTPTQVQYEDGFVLAYATDADGRIVAAVANSAIPTGLAMNNSNGDLYISDVNSLSSGTYAIAVTTTDALGHSTSLVFNVIIAVPATPQCGPSLLCNLDVDRCCNDYNTGHRCYNFRTHACAPNNVGLPTLCLIGFQACFDACYDPAVYCCDTSLKQKGQCAN